LLTNSFEVYFMQIRNLIPNLHDNYVIGEIIKEYSNAGLDVRSHLAFYRDSNGKEIDLLIVDNGKIYPIEIKKSANPDKDALKNFSVIDSLDLPRGEGAVICLSSMSYSLDKDNKAIPISYI
jgi:uncharacterized protein